MRVLSSIPVLLALALSTPASAQIPFVDILMEHDDANDQLRVFLRANDYDFGELVSSISFTVRWPEASTATLSFGSSAWCPYPNSAFQPTPAAMITPGNGFKYRNWTFFGTGAFLVHITDDGGCDNTLLSNTWIEVVTIPVNNDPGGTVFEIAADQYATDNNLLYFISLNGEGRTGAVFSGTTAVVETEPVPVPFTVFPNPAATATTITFNEGNAGTFTVELVDASGRTVSRTRGSGTIVMEMIDHAPGAYQLKVTGDEGSWSRPLVIQR